MEHNLYGNLIAILEVEGKRVENATIKQDEDKLTVVLNENENEETEFDFPNADKTYEFLEDSELLVEMSKIEQITERLQKKGKEISDDSLTFSLEDDIIVISFLDEDTIVTYAHGDPEDGKSRYRTREVDTALLFLEDCNFLRSV